ncbi:MAG: hypothetical protein KC996_03620 [Phycisphaerales bacterium]|nr:hypothetical protein [Phycisphaerales bacterium]
MSANDTTTWATLLAGWVHFAQSAVALPKDETGERWRASIAPAIALHALSMALTELHKLDPDERPLAMDKAELGIKEHAATLNESWGGEPMPESLMILMGDARTAWEESLHEGVVWIVSSDRFITRHPADITDKLLDTDFLGEIFIATPGTELFEGAPVAWTRDNAGGQPDDEVIKIISEFLQTCEGDTFDPQIVRPVHQVYRQFNFLGGGVQRDLVAPVTGELPPGQPLLIPLLVGGEICPVPLPPRASKPIDPVPVQWADADEEARAEGS